MWQPLVRADVVGVLESTINFFHNSSLHQSLLSPLKEHRTMSMYMEYQVRLYLQ